MAHRRTTQPKYLVISVFLLHVVGLRLAVAYHAQCFSILMFIKFNFIENISQMCAVLAVHRSF